MNLNRVFRTTMLFCVLLAFSCASDVALRKKQEEAKRNVGEAYLAERNFYRCIERATGSGKVVPDDPLLQNCLGLAYMGKKRLDLAVVHFKKPLP